MNLLHGNWVALGSFQRQKSSRWFTRNSCHLTDCVIKSAWWKREQVEGAVESDRILKQWCQETFQTSFESGKFNALWTIARKARLMHREFKGLYWRISGENCWKGNEKSRFFDLLRFLWSEQNIKARKVKFRENLKRVLKHARWRSVFFSKVFLQFLNYSGSCLSTVVYLHLIISRVVVTST
jgi:hypothetical protein